MATVQDLINQYDGHIFGITGPDTGQCTAVAHAWEEMLGLPIVYGNAKDTFANAPDDLYHKELNTPEGVPSPGAIMVWDDKWGGGYGHTAVVVSANVNTFDCLEQNDGDGGKTHVGRHNYADTIGWFTPKVLDAPVPEPTPEPAPVEETPIPVTVTPVEDPTPDPAPVIVPPVIEVKPVEKLKSRKLWTTVVAALIAVALYSSHAITAGQSLTSVTFLSGLYVAVQGAIDHKSAGQ